mgnify:FL=1
MGRFALTEQHIALLRRARIQWEDCETGAPAIDPKRPYGNSGVAQDVAKILGLEGKMCPHCGECVDESNECAMLTIHRESEIALCIILADHTIEPGVYESHLDVPYDEPKWSRTKDGE